MAKKNIAVLGATGQVGHIVFEELNKKGHKVRAIGRDPKKLEFLKSRGAEVFTVDSFDNVANLTKAFNGIDAAFVMIPPNFNTDNYATFQDKAGEAIKEAIQKNSVRHVVNLSSLGANFSEGTGPIKGLHRQEERLKTLKDVNVVNLRPGYFMENLFWSIGSVLQTGTIRTPLSPNVPFFMVSTVDIGVISAEFLDKLEFKGQTIFDLVGPDNNPTTLNEVTKLIGKAIQKPDLKYVQLNYEEAKKDWVSSGMKEKTADLMNEMYKAFNEGKCNPTQELTPEHHGRIKIEQFAQGFAQAYKYTEQQIKIRT